MSVSLWGWGRDWRSGLRCIAGVGDAPHWDRDAGTIKRNDRERRVGERQSSMRDFLAAAVNILNVYRLEHK
jgi:hypothetical protein